MGREAQRHKRFSRRAAILAGGQGLLVAVLCGRLYQLQIVDFEPIQAAG